MAITETRNLPAQFIEDLGKDYAKQLTATTAIPVDTSKFAPTVAGQDALQKQAATLAGSGVGSFQPFIDQAKAQGTAAGQTVGDVGTTLSGIAGLTGAPTSAQIQQYMSPYQSQELIQLYQSLIDKELYKKNQLLIKRLHQEHLVVDVKVYKEPSINLNQIETEQHYKHNYYNKVLVKHNKQHKINTNNKLD